jgi:hypothetical protein
MGSLEKQCLLTTTVRLYWYLDLVVGQDSFWSNLNFKRVSSVSLQLLCKHIIHFQRHGLKKWQICVMSRQETESSIKAYLVCVGWTWPSGQRLLCASIPRITGSNPSGSSKLTFRSDLLFTARGGSTWALIEFACLLCYSGNTLCSQCLEPPGRVGKAN